MMIKDDIPFNEMEEDFMSAIRKTAQPAKTLHSNPILISSLRFYL